MKFFGISFSVLVAVLMVGCGEDKVDEKSQAVVDEMKDSSERESVLEDFRPVVELPGALKGSADNETEDEAGVSE
ncbi:MAG: hypothetical protein ACRBCS_15955 [Cellvibrionaceae bacterium]